MEVVPSKDVLLFPKDNSQGDTCCEKYNSLPKENSTDKENAPLDL